MREDIRSFLHRVEKPGRYTGGEPGSVYKDLRDVRLRVAFCFPDTYEIGMSNLGMRILCQAFNELDHVWCERVYAPWVDMEKEMRDRQIPLFTHESGDPVGDFDMVAFTLQYEMCYTTVLNMMDLAHIPLRSADRGEGDPIILAGGPCAYNPEPMAPFVDIFSIGEGEEALPELAKLYLSMKENGTYTKAAFLREASHLDGFYVPALYEVTYHSDHTIASVAPKHPDVPEKVRRRIVADVDHTVVPTAPVMPYIETVQDRVTLEVFRSILSESLQPPHIPVPSIIIGFIETVTGTPYGFAVRVTNFIIISGPIVIIISKLSPASSISLSGTVTFPCLPYEPSSVIMKSLSDAARNSSSHMRRSFERKPIMLVTAAPIS